MNRESRRERCQKPRTQRKTGCLPIPTRMTLLAAYGDRQAAASLVSMEAMRGLPGGSVPSALRPKTNYESLLRQILMLRYDEVVDMRTGKPYPDKIEELLETVKVPGRGQMAPSLPLINPRKGDGAMSITLCRDWTDFGQRI